MIHEFNDSLSIGDKGELIFHDAYSSHGWQKENKGVWCSYDFRRKSDGKTLELKTDDYSMSATPNFFIEYQSNASKNTLGGPFREGADLFAYLYIKNLTIFFFERLQLVEKIIELGYLDHQLKIPENATKGIRSVSNNGYKTTGFCIPREELACIAKVRVLDKTRNTIISRGGPDGKELIL